MSRSAKNAEYRLLGLDADVLVHWTMTGAPHHRAVHKRILDTSLAATLKVAGASSLATLNGRDFKIFPFLEIVDPVASAGAG